MFTFSAYHKQSVNKIKFKNKGGLILGADYACKVIIKNEKLFLIHNNYLEILNVPNLNLIIIFQVVINKCSLDNSFFFFREINYKNISILESSHRIVLIILRTNKFLSSRLKSFGEMFSSNILNPQSK